MNKRINNAKKNNHRNKKGNGEDITKSINIEITNAHIDAAAAAIRQMKDLAGGMADAQISIAIMSVWLCMASKIPGDEFINGIFRNMNAIGNNQQLLVELNNTIVASLKEVSILMPGQDF